MGVDLSRSTASPASNLRRAGVVENVIMQIGRWWTRSVFCRYWKRHYAFRSQVGGWPHATL